MSAALQVGGFSLRRIGFADLTGWAEAGAADVWSVFRQSAAALVEGASSQRPARAANPDLVEVCRDALAQPSELKPDSAQRFFESRFAPHRVEATGLLTGYYEPVVDGSLTRTADFTAPILPRPDDLVTVNEGDARDGLPDDHAAGRRGPDGGLTVYPDRAALEDFALGPEARPIVWLRDWTEVFLIHVQGSARVRLPDGRALRLTYAGRNGHPYTSIGRILIDGGVIPEADMSLDRLKAWLRGAGEAARSLMRRNRSYIFFGAEPAVDALGPVGGAGLPLTAHRSIAVDRSLWSYGLPFWIETDRAVPGFGEVPLRRLFVAQDTGSAIVGAARADLFLGSGEAAGQAAGLIRHTAAFTVLLPCRP